MGYPAENDVRAGVAYGENNELSGLCAIPATTDVRYGIAFDVGATVGSCYVPAAADVRLTVPVDATTGTYDPVAAAVFPAAANVWHDTGVYGPTGIDYTPEMVGSDIANLVPGNVADGVTIDDVLGNFAGGGGLTKQDVADAFLLAPNGNAAEGSPMDVLQSLPTEAIAKQDVADAFLLAPNGNAVEGSPMDVLQSLPTEAIDKQDVADAFLLAPNGNAAEGSPMDVLQSLPTQAIDKQDVADAQNMAPAGTSAVGSVQARLKTIEAKAAQIGAAEIEATGPLNDDGTVMTLRRGDEYSAALGRAAVWVDSSDSWPYIGDADAVTLTLRSVETGAELLSKEGTVGLVGDHQGITIELAAEDTVDLPTGIYVADFDVEVTWAGKGPWTLPVEGRVIVIEDLTSEEEPEE